MSGPPHPFITPFLVAAHEGRTALDLPEDTAPLPPPVEPLLTDSNQLTPPRQLNAVNPEGATERKWHHYFASPFEGRRARRISVLDRPMRVDMPDDGMPEGRRLEPNLQHPPTLLPSPYSSPPNSNYIWHEPFGPPADYSAGCPPGIPGGDPRQEEDPRTDLLAHLIADPQFPHAEVPRMIHLPHWEEAMQPKILLRPGVAQL